MTACISEALTLPPSLDRPVRGHQRRRRPLGLPLHPAPRGRGVRRGGHLGPEARGGRLERRWRPHELLDEDDARGRRYRRDRAGDRAHEQAPREAHQGVRSPRGQGQRAPTYRQVRDQQHPRLQQRRRRPHRQYSHSAQRRRGQEGIPRGPPAEQQLRSLLRHERPRAHLHPQRVSGIELRAAEDTKNTLWTRCDLGPDDVDGVFRRCILYIVIGTFE